ncbi:hypothetical protein [Rubellimicrobium arenae]|uniref:hypothetical protein n=1 Tax=Rubellimicrobium arenae TaxID=2817372 RepID=UPI001B311062|nr:hypothetical protein [Rubellimicrobium arenae]
MPDSENPTPAARRLRVYAFDPQASIELETAVINDAVISLPWETAWEDPVTIGPCNDYLEVIDYDPACDLFYAPIELNDARLLAQDGLPPSEGRPQFHQQMVFAVAMKTIRLFERALGRPVFWTRETKRSPGDESDNSPQTYELIKRLRIYPHALREANAYYSPDKTALLFGYFKKGGGGDFEDGGWVFTCLSQDIIAHETTHAILHGMRRRSIEASNPDSLAFHEGFADLVALFLHFTMTDVVAHQIAQARGSLRASNLLTGLARQFGQARGRNGPLRYALELIDEELKAAERTAEGQPDRERTDRPRRTLADTAEAHDRGGFLVAAVFDAFVTIYERRTADLMRLAIGGSRPDGRELPPDLVARLASEASKAADHVLRMCVRALDYLPPVDANFGDYLRAIVTADADLVPDDPMRYRIALIEAFRKRGIFVPGCLSMSPDSLAWPSPVLGRKLEEEERKHGLFASLLSELRLSNMFQQSAAPKGGLPSPASRERLLEQHPANQVQYRSQAPQRHPNYRESALKVIDWNQRATWSWFNRPSPANHEDEWERLLGVKMKEGGALRSIPTSSEMKKMMGRDLPAIEVHSVRIARRAGPNGEELQQLIIQITQRRRAYYDPERQALADSGALAENDKERWDHPDFWFRGGATLLIDMRDGRLRTVIRNSIDDEVRLERQRKFRGSDVFGLALSGRNGRAEPFAFVHGC